MGKSLTYLLYCSPGLPWRLWLSGGLDLDGPTMGRHLRWTSGWRSRWDTWRGTRRWFRRAVVCYSWRTQCRMFPRDALEEVSDPALLLLLRVGQQKQLFGSGHVIVHCEEMKLKTDYKESQDDKGYFKSNLIQINLTTLKQHTTSPKSSYTEWPEK